MPDFCGSSRNSAIAPVTVPPSFSGMQAVRSGSAVDALG